MESLSITDLKHVLTKPTNTIYFFENTEQLVDEMEEAKRFGNERTYKSVLGVLKNFHRRKSLRFEEITYAYTLRFLGLDAIGYNFMGLATLFAAHALEKNDI